MTTTTTTLCLSCPHCFEFILITEINCAIFRHAVYKHNGEPIDPHSSKETCDELIKKDLIYGCGKPFKLLWKEKEYVCEICEYL
jgi:hypothetical protein